MFRMLEAELTQYKDKNHVDEILRQLELEREKNTQLSIQLQQQISRSLVLLFVRSLASVTGTLIPLHVWRIEYKMCWYLQLSWRQQLDFQDQIPLPQLWLDEPRQKSCCFISWNVLRCHQVTLIWIRHVESSHISLTHLTCHVCF